MTYTKAQVRAAIISVANLFESNPKLFNFSSVKTPSDCGTPGCALGHIAFALGDTGPHWLGTHQALGVRCDVDFYRQMNSIDWEWNFGKNGINGTVAAATLRAYADKYFPAADIEQHASDTRTASQESTRSRDDQVEPPDSAGALVTGVPSNDCRALVRWEDCVWMPKALRSVERA